MDRNKIASELLKMARSLVARTEVARQEDDIIQALSPAFTYIDGDERKLYFSWDHPVRNADVRDARGTARKLLKRNNAHYKKVDAYVAEGFMVEVIIF